MKCFDGHICQHDSHFNLYEGLRRLLRSESMLILESTDDGWLYSVSSMNFSNFSNLQRYKLTICCLLQKKFLILSPYLYLQSNSCTGFLCERAPMKIEMKAWPPLCKAHGLKIWGEKAYSLPLLMTLNTTPPLYDTLGACNMTF